MRRCRVALMAGLVLASVLMAGCSLGWRHFEWKPTGGADFTFAVDYPDYFAPQQDFAPVKGRVVLLGVATQGSLNTVPAMLSVTWSKLGDKQTLEEYIHGLAAGRGSWKQTRLGGQPAYQWHSEDGIVTALQPAGTRSVCLAQLLYGRPKHRRVIRDCGRMLDSIRVAKR